MTTPKNMPACSFQNPRCGSCGDSLEWDEHYFCEYCGLNYGDGEDETAAVYEDEELDQCGTRCTNKYHENPNGHSWHYACEPCTLPDGHRSPHWNPCGHVLDEETAAKS